VPTLLHHPLLHIFYSKFGIFVAAGKEEQKLPYLLYLQGGPGFECRPPTESSGWVQKVCEEFRLILMDQAWFTRHLCNHLCDTQRNFMYNLFCCLCTFLQRGTGLSTPLTVSSMSQFKSAEELADFLKHFRADNIVNDAELIRVRLVPDAGPWSILGQVFKLMFFTSIRMSCWFWCPTSLVLQSLIPSFSFFSLYFFPVSLIIDIFEFCCRYHLMFYWFRSFG